tara:strand:- start:742 stop:1008 length:267 start_codon:yes stop_codon:yes gene_type:complete
MRSCCTVRDSCKSSGFQFGHDHWVFPVQVGKAKIDRMGIWLPSKAIMEAIEQGVNLNFGHDNFSCSGFYFMGSERCTGIDASIEDQEN